MTLIEELGFCGNFSELTEEQKKIYRAETYNRFLRNNPEKRREYMKRAKQYEFQMTQQQNAKIGRYGA